VRYGLSITATPLHLPYCLTIRRRIAELSCYEAHFLSDVTNLLSVSSQCVYLIQRVAETPVALPEHSATSVATHIALLTCYLNCLIGNYI
jgi:hypothetical protein